MNLTKTLFILTLGSSVANCSGSSSTTARRGTPAISASGSPTPFPMSSTPVSPVNPLNPSVPIVTTSPVPPVLENSGGSGGQTGDQEIKFSATNGKSSSYKIAVPKDVAEKLYGLQIHLHGDGGGEYDWFVEDNARIGASHNLIGVVIRAPNSEYVWYNEGMENAQFLHELIQNDIFRKYNINKNKVYFSGASGGSQFLTGQFLPVYGKNYNSGAVLLCGGPANWQNKIDAPPTFIKTFKFSWYTGSGDFLVDQVKEGIAYYKKLGFQVESEIMSSGDHCVFPGGLAGALEKKLPLVLH